MILVQLLDSRSGVCYVKQHLLSDDGELRDHVLNRSVPGPLILPEGRAEEVHLLQGQQVLTTLLTHLATDTHTSTHTRTYVRTHAQARMHMHAHRHAHTIDLSMHFQVLITFSFSKC